jgi:glycosyltransferase involved in cell wall biosynthesis
MRIAIDARELCGEPTGVGRYLASVLTAWRDQAQAAAHDYVLCAHGPLPTLDLSPLRVEVLETSGGGGTAWEQTRLPFLIRASGADVLFAPAYTSPVWCPAPVVLALHDVSFSAHPEWFPRRQGLRRRLLAGRAARQAAHVLTLTEFSKREIRERLGVPDHRITVVPPGVTAWPTPPPSTIRGANVLFVGSIFNRRHVPELLEAIALLARRHPEVTLTLVGHNRTSPRVDLGGLIDSLGIGARTVHHDYVADADLADLYYRARAFVFLSEYEGFGLTPLEALAAGVPPVVLDTAVARETCGAAAVHVAQPHPAAIAGALEQALFDDNVRRQVLEASRSVLAQYAWATCADGVLRALESAGSR